MPKPVKVKARAPGGQGVAYYPLAQELEYALAAARRARRLSAQLRAVIQKNGGKRAVELIDALEREFAGLPFTQEIARAGNAVEKFGTAQTARIIGESISIDPRKIRDVLTGKPLAPLLNVWAEVNAELIKGIDKAQIDQVRDLVVSAQATGQSAEALAKQIEERAGVSESRSRMIARDQVGKLNAAVSAERQLSLGVEQYTWQTALDERVRPAHKARQGQVFSWSKPPSDGHPGEPVNCRCVARPIIPPEIDIFGD